jgi:hypothetical protein
VFLAILNEGLKFFILIKNSPRSLSSFCIKFRSFVKFISFVLTPELLPDKKKKVHMCFMHAVVIVMGRSLNIFVFIDRPLKLLELVVFQVQSVSVSYWYSVSFVWEKLRKEDINDSM